MLHLPTANATPCLLNKSSRHCCYWPDWPSSGFSCAFIIVITIITVIGFCRLQLASLFWTVVECPSCSANETTEHKLVPSSGGHSGNVKLTPCQRSGRTAEGCWKMNFLKVQHQKDTPGPENPSQTGLFSPKTGERPSRIQIKRCVGPNPSQTQPHIKSTQAHGTATYFGVAFVFAGTGG